MLDDDDDEDEGTGRKRLKRAKDKENEHRESKLRAAKLKKKRMKMNTARRFIESEAGLDSDDEGFYSNDEVDDDSAGSLADFINDGSDVGVLRDSLDVYDRDNIEEAGGVLHRKLDALNEPVRFGTPVLRRRRRSSLSSSTRGSDAGIGSMHFIRSVVNHYNEGGTCDQVESEYHRLEEEGQGEGGNDSDDKMEVRGGVNLRVAKLRVKTAHSLISNDVNANARHRCSARRTTTWTLTTCQTS